MHLATPFRVKGLTAAALFIVSATISSAANISLTSAYPSDISGNPVAVALGESFYLTAKLNVEGSLNSHYRLRFDLPYATRTTPEVAFVGQATVAWGPFTALTDKVAVRVSVESSSDTAGPALQLQLQPQLPTGGLEYFNPQRLTGVVGATAKLTSGTAAGMMWYSPVPSSGGFQEVAFTSSVGSITQSQPYGQKVLTTGKVGSAEVSYETTARASRINPNVLKGVGFSAYKSLAANVSVWLNPETLVQSRAGDVTSFVNSKLPKNFKTTMTPFAAAQSLFQGVVQRIQYVDTGLKPDAVVALKTGKGDCGYFSAAFVAACRNIGIPARTVCGMNVGYSTWHIWAEFYIPGHGWIPADASFCDELSPDGSQALYFGTVPDLNERVAVTYGFDHIVGGRKLPMLQSPAVVTSGATRISGVQPYCTLRPVGIAP